VSRVRLNWQMKAVLPVAAVLVNGLLLFVLVTLSQENTQRNTVLVIATAGAVAICAVMIMVLAVVVHRPMTELQDKIERVREGDLNVSVNFSNRNDEIGDLGKDFNDMVRQLRESREEIQRLHRTQISRAEHLATLGELAAGLAHEIRNPLAGIAGVIDVIGRDLPKESPARSVLKDVRSEVLHINRIVSELLEIARPKQPEFRMADLNATAEHAVMFAKDQAASRGVEIELTKDAEGIEIEHDAGQIRQVLLNLLLNGVQACDQGGKVALQVAHTDDSVQLTVVDTGKGIPPDVLENIFRPFFTTKGDGTGLGLSLAQRMVEGHGGRLEVSSWVGKGSRFVISLPKERPQSVGA
jgi:signal transduction histidine kinase